MRILLATDGSQPADRARDLMVAMSWPRGTSIRVVSVVPKSADVTARWTPDTATVPDVDRLADHGVRTHVLALDALESGPFCAAYNLGCSGAGYSVLDVIETAARITNRSIDVDIAPIHEGASGVDP